jgi:hypothetical protein
LESLFTNPLFYDKLDFVPRRVWKTAARLVRVYSEWLTGDAVWEIQVRAVVDLNNLRYLILVAGSVTPRRDSSRHRTFI